MLLLAALTWWLTQPRQIKEFENVGQPFFADFENSSDASSLEVLAVDANTAEVKSFRVEEKNGVWTIPSHYGYPAEAADRLARCSSSLIGLTRESLVGRTRSDHERFGVLDPLDEDLLDPEAAGKRVTLKDSSGNVLADLIIGNQAEERDATDREVAFQSQQRSEYFVRHPDETQTYKIGLDLDLSTKFSDWIRPDLLDLETSDMTRMLVDNYELQEQADPFGRLTQLFKKQGDQLLFNRNDGFGKWNLDGLDESKEELDDSKLNTAASTLANLKIVGVRKKTGYQDQQLLTPDLQLNRIPELEANPAQFRQIMAQLQAELSDYGFNLAPAGQGSQDLMLVSNFGELKAGTSKGVVYTLQFGNPIDGDEYEIEIGGSANSDQDDANVDETEAANADQEPSADNDAGNDEKQDAVEDAANEEDAKSIKNRYLMIRVAFDESLLGDQPVAPVAPTEPVKPEGYVAAPDESDAAGDPNDSDDAPKPPSDGTGAEEKSDDESTSTEESTDDRPEEFKQYDVAKAAFDQKKTEFELELTKFEDDQKAFNEKVEEANKLVAELNERFGAWFYVISADNLESLQLQRVDMVKAKEVEKIETSLPDRPNLDIGDGGLQVPQVPAPETQPDAG